MAWNDPRPMSPHLQIYRLPLTAKLSILHRFTGIILFGFLFYLMIVLAMFSYGGAEAWYLHKTFMKSIPGFILILLTIFSLYYHTFNGIRHLLWDVGHGLDLEASQHSGKLVVVLAVLMTLCSVLVMWLQR